MTERDRIAWSNGKPIFERLPYVGYQDNTLAEALTDGADILLSEARDKLQDWYKELHPDTCQDSSLDFLAHIVGFSGDYWVQNWEPEVKRELIRNSHLLLWRYRGTLKVISKVLDIHGIPHKVWTNEGLRLTFAMPKTFGESQPLKFFIQVPLTVGRLSEDWKESDRTLRAYAPAVCKTRTCYEKFKIGYSLVGDPMF